MNDKDWEIIKTLHEERSITRAANRLYLSQPALTYRLDQIEKEMDIQLFMRSTKGINFTSAGERLVTYAEKMLREYFDMKRFVKSQDGQINGMLRLGSSAVFAHNQLPFDNPAAGMPANINFAANRQSPGCWKFPGLPGWL